MKQQQIYVASLLTLLCFVYSINCLVVKIATILPADNRRIFSIDRITPAIQMAIDELSNNYTLVENLTFSVEYADSQCEIAEAINQAIDFYINKKVDVFFGPVCDYAVAPVARQTRFWNLPLISCGAMARDFSTYRKTQYPELTRVGPVNFNSLSSFFVQLFKHSNWKSLKILYSREGHADVFDDFCHLCVEAIHYDIIEKAKEIKQDYFRLVESSDLRKVLLEELGLTFGDVGIMSMFIGGRQDKKGDPPKAANLAGMLHVMTTKSTVCNIMQQYNYIIMYYDVEGIHTVDIVRILQKLHVFRVTSGIERSHLEGMKTGEGTVGGSRPAQSRDEIFHPGLCLPSTADPTNSDMTRMNQHSHTTLSINAKPQGLRNVYRHVRVNGESHRKLCSTAIEKAARLSVADLAVFVSMVCVYAVVFVSRLIHQGGAMCGTIYGIH